MERSLPTYLHGKVKGLFFAAFLGQDSPCVETRMKVRTGLYLIPDVAVFYPQEPEQVPETPPLVVIEVLSPDDRMTAVLEKLEEYRGWGVRHVWLVDPHARRMYAWDAGLREVERLATAEVGVEIGRREILGMNDVL